MTRMSHDEHASCGCVNDHNPNPMELHRHHIWPLYAGGPDTEDNLVWLCPTSHVNVHELLRAYEEHGGRPPWDIRKRFNYKIRTWAERGWEKMQG